MRQVLLGKPIKSMMKNNKQFLQAIVVTPYCDPECSPMQTNAAELKARRSCYVKPLG